MTLSLLSRLTDDELVAALPRLAGDERLVTARLVAHLAELERRRLYVPAGYASLYVYCREALGYSEDAAYNRKTAAHVARRFPLVVEMLADGRLNLTSVRLLAPLLRDDNWEGVFAEAAGASKRDVEALVARLAPKPDVPPTIRILPTPAAAVPERQGQSVPSPSPSSPAAPPGTPSPMARPTVAPLSPERYRVQFTIGAETEKKLRRLQELLRREVPSGDPALIFDRALTALLETVEARKHGVTARPRAPRALAQGSRRVPSATRREVAPRDGGRCAYVGPGGTRCSERAYVEYHHAGTPFAHGGGPGAKNIALHCRAHNAYEAERIFGRYLPPEIREARARYYEMPAAVPERPASPSGGARTSGST